jgi:predicted transcriptional regulator
MEETLIEDILIKLGYSRCVAKVLSYFLENHEGYACDIENTKRLRQPEVSLAINELINKKYLDSSTVRVEGKGRPKYFYRLLKSASDVINDIEYQENKDIEHVREMISKLKMSLKS